MAGQPIADASIQGQCAFAGTVVPAATSARVTIGGQQVLVAGPPPTVTGCAFTTGTNPAPCLTATPQQATRVTADGQPVLLVTSTWTNSGGHPPAPILFQVPQQRVVAT